MKSLKFTTLSNTIRDYVFLTLIGILCFATINVQAEAMLNPTPPASEGPYWKSGSPQRATLYQENDFGERIKVIGKVLDVHGQTISGAKIDIWQTDGKGRYDNSGYDFRGHVITNSKGEYLFNTVKPGEYPSRTAHIHIKISTQDGRQLTTQLYFPEFSNRNNRDFLYHKNLNVTWVSDSEAKFDFVLE